MNGRIRVCVGASERDSIRIRIRIWENKSFTIPQAGYLLINRTHKLEATHCTSKLTIVHTNTPSRARTRAATWLLCSGCMENLFNSCYLLSAAVAVVVCWFDCHCPFCRFRSLPLHDFSIWWISLHWTHIGLTSFWTIYSAKEKKIYIRKNVENTPIS